MTAIEGQLLAALEELDHAVKTMSAAKTKPDLLAVFQRLEELSRRLPPAADARLRHYLERKSYEKARLLLAESAVSALGDACAALEPTERRIEGKHGREYVVRVFVPPGPF